MARMGFGQSRLLAGLGIVQDPHVARDPHMPLSASMGDRPNFIVPLDRSFRDIQAARLVDA
jgi:hypothetical protein